MRFPFEVYRRGPNFYRQSESGSYNPDPPRVFFLPVPDVLPNLTVTVANMIRDTVFNREFGYAPPLRFIGDLVQEQERDIQVLERMGPVRMKELAASLVAFGDKENTPLHFGMQIPNWPPLDLENKSRAHTEAWKAQGGVISAPVGAAYIEAAAKMLQKLSKLERHAHIHELVLKVAESGDFFLKESDAVSLGIAKDYAREVFTHALVEFQRIGLLPREGVQPPAVAKALLGALRERPSAQEQGNEQRRGALTRMGNVLIKTFIPR